MRRAINSWLHQQHVTSATQSKQVPNNKNLQRQCQAFSVAARDKSQPQPTSLDTGRITSITRKLHLASFTSISATKSLRRCTEMLNQCTRRSTYIPTVYTRLYSLRFSCKIVSLTAANTNLMFSVSTNHNTQHHYSTTRPTYYSSEIPKIFK